MKKDKLREELEHLYYDKHNHSRYNWKDVCEFEEKFLKFKKYKLKKNIVSAALALTITASGIFGISYINKTLNFPEPEYRQSSNITPDYYNEFPINVYINEKDFKPSQVETIKEVLKELDNKCDGFKISVMPEYDFSICDINISTDTLENDFGSLYLGVTYGSLPNNRYSEIKIDKNFAKLTTKIFKYVVEHEILHSLGLEHTKNPTSIMFPYVLYHNPSQKDYENLNTLYPTKANESTAENILSTQDPELEK